MSRIRSVHPGLWTDVEFVGLSPFARLLFIGIWNECDDQGTFVWSPLQLKMRLLPADNLDAAELLNEIERASAIVRYEIAGKAYGAVRNFTKFQRPKKPNKVNPTTPEILAFAGGTADARDGDDGGGGSEPTEDKPDLIPNQLPTDGEKPPQREEGGGRKEEIEEQPDGRSLSRAGANKSTAKKSQTVIPDDWEPTEFGVGTKCRGIMDAWPPGGVDLQIEHFIAHHRARGSRFVDWQDAWKTWVINSFKFGNSNGRSNQLQLADRSTAGAAAGAMARLHAAGSR